MQDFIFKMNFAIVVGKLIDDVENPKYTKIVHANEQTLLISGMNESMNFIFAQFKLRYTRCFVKRFKVYTKIMECDDSLERLDRLFSADYFYGGSAYFNSRVFQDSFFSQKPEDLKESVQCIQHLSNCMAEMLTLDLTDTD